MARRDVKRGTSVREEARRAPRRIDPMGAQPRPAAEDAAARDAELLVPAGSDYERTELLLARELRRAPNESEIAEKLEWTVERTRYVAQVVAEARRRHDEELLAFIDPDAIDFDETVDGE